MDGLCPASFAELRLAQGPAGDDHQGFFPRLGWPKGTSHANRDSHKCHIIFS